MLLSGHRSRGSRGASPNHVRFSQISSFAQVSNSASAAIAAASRRKAPSSSASRSCDPDELEIYVNESDCLICRCCLPARCWTGAHCGYFLLRYVLVRVDLRSTEIHRDRRELGVDARGVGIPEKDIRSCIYREGPDGRYVVGLRHKRRGKGPLAVKPRSYAAIYSRQLLLSPTPPAPAHLPGQWGRRQPEGQTHASWFSPRGGPQCGDPPGSGST
jgi:hypothetical protein